MVQQDTSLTKRNIIDFIEKNGPSLPAHISSEIKQSMLFSSAFLAELLSEKKLVLSHMKVGSSPLYLISGQEFLLEKYSIYVKGKPGEAYSLIKDKKYLKDSEQLPAIRVALRSIKDFAKPFKFKEEIYWRYLTNSVEDFLKSKKDLEANEIEENIEGGGKRVSEVKELGVVEKVVEENIEEKNIGEKIEGGGKRVSEAKEFGVVEFSEDKEEKKVKEVENIFKKDKVGFLEQVRNFLKKENVLVLEETEIKKREFLGRGRIQSDLGEIEVLIIAKDKKNVTEKDIEKAFDEVKSRSMLVLLLSTGEIAKKAKDFYRVHKNIVRFVKIL